jgi:hypothetical protein
MLDLIRVSRPPDNLIISWFKSHFLHRSQIDDRANFGHASLQEVEVHVGYYETLASMISVVISTKNGTLLSSLESEHLILDGLPATWSIAIWCDAARPNHPVLNADYKLTVNQPNEHLQYEISGSCAGNSDACKQEITAIRDSFRVEKVLGASSLK